MLKVLVRTVLMYVFVSVAVRMMGKRQIGDMQPTELVITLLISEIAAIPLQDISQPLSIGLVAIFTLVFLEIVASILILKNLRLRRIFSGKAVVLMKNGVLDQKAMKNVRITVFDLLEMLRMQGVFSLADVDSVFLEVNGNISVRPKPNRTPPTADEMGITPTDNGLAMAVISDGKVVDSSLAFLQKNRDDLLALLKEKKLTVGEIFIMTLDQSGQSVIVKKERK